MNVAVFKPVVDTDTVGDADPNDETDALADGETRLEEVTSIEALGEPEIVKVIVVLVRADSVAVFKPDDDTDAVGDEDAIDDTDAILDGETRLE